MGDAVGPGVVMGAAVGYGYRQVKTFVTSLRATGFDGPVVLLLDRRLPLADLAPLEADGVTPYLVSDTSWLVVENGVGSRLARLALRSPLGVRALRDRSDRDRLHLQSASNRRFGLYAEARWALPSLFDPAPWVFLSDVRDVYFQHDPTEAFDRAIAEHPLHLFAEGPPPGFDHGPDGVFRIAEATNTLRWIRGLATDEVTDRLAAERVICSGTILVARPSLVELASRMVAPMARLHPGRTTFGFDQGALNLLYYTGRLDDLDPVVHDNGTGGLATLGALAKAHPDTWSFADGEVRIAGEVPAVVHQYDRDPALRQAWYDES